MSTPKRPNNKRTLEEKKAILDAAAKNSNRSALAKQFDVPRTTTNDILSQKQSIFSAIDGGSEAKLARLTSGKHQQMEGALIRWHKQIRSQNVPVSGKLLKEKALAIANKLEIVDFKASEECLTNFKGRHGIEFKTEQNEAGSIDVGSVCEWKEKGLFEALALFSAEDIFNPDETGLFWQLLPNKTMAFKATDAHYRARLSGSQKLPLLVSGRSAKPRCFKNVNMPAEYEANKKAWMAGSIFETFLEKWDKKLKKDDQGGASKEAVANH